MIWWSLLIALVYGVWWLARKPVPDDVVVKASGGSLRVYLKGHESRLYSDSEWLVLNTRLFLGVRAAFVARRLRFRREMSS